MWQLHWISFVKLVQLPFKVTPPHLIWHMSLHSWQMMFKNMILHHESQRADSQKQNKNLTQNSSLCLSWKSQHRAMLSPGVYSLRARFVFKRWNTSQTLQICYQELWCYLSSALSIFSSASVREEALQINSDTCWLRNEAPFTPLLTYRQLHCTSWVYWEQLT